MNARFVVMAVVLATAAASLIALDGAAARGKNRVDVLVEGYVRPIDGREFLPGATDHGARRVASTIGLVRGPDVTLVVDPGMIDERSRLTDALAKHDVDPADVTHVFISHHHPDHTVLLGLFPNAEVVDFWARYKGDLWEDHGDDYELAPGIRVLRTPGHTKEDASLLVETDDGTYLFTHLWWMADRTPATDPLAWSQDEIDRHRERVAKLADWIVPGHGGTFKNER